VSSSPSTEMNGQRPPAFDGQASNAVGSVAGTCSRSTSSTWRSVVKDVKGTGDPRGIIDAVGRCQSAWRWRRQKRAALVPLRRAIWPALSGQYVATKYKKGSYRICTCTGELVTPFSLVRIQLAAEMEA
jgi:hypothetical protein